MRPTDQTRFGRQGNCLAACFATIIGVPLQLVDFSCADATKERDWFALAIDKLRPLGWSYVDWHLSRDKDGLLQLSVPEHLLIVVAGKSPREPGLLHAVVHQMQKRILVPVHDPHPSRAGILDMQYAGVLMPTYSVSCRNGERSDERQRGRL